MRGIIDSISGWGWVVIVCVIVAGVTTYMSVRAYSANRYTDEPED